MMKRSLAIATLVILALAVPATLLAQQNSKAEKEVRALIEQSRQVNLKGGSEAAAFAEKYLHRRHCKNSGHSRAEHQGRYHERLEYGEA